MSPNPMLIRVGYELTFITPVPTPMLLLLSLHPSRLPTVRRPEQLSIEPYCPMANFSDSFGNRVTRIVAPAGQVTIRNDAIIEDPGTVDEYSPNAVQHPIDELPVDALRFLFASRYCEVDLLQNIAWDLFGHTAPGWSRVQAICDWVHSNVTFGYQHARSTKTADDVYYERRGVCRDFTHLAVTFCRCMNIPARYVTGYLGDIGVPFSPAPMDFSAWFEVYLSGRWWTFDARHNIPRIGRVLMARGRDATDVALTTVFGPNNLQKFIVWTDEIKG